MYFFCLYIVQFSSFASLLFFVVFVIVKWKQQKSLAIQRWKTLGRCTVTS